MTDLERFKELYQNFGIELREEVSSGNTILVYFPCESIEFRAFTEFSLEGEFIQMWCLG